MGTTHQFIEANREFIANVTPLCEDLITLTKGMNDKTIFNGARALLRFSEEFKSYNTLVDGGDYEDVSFKDEFESCFNSMMRQQNKSKRLTLEWTIEEEYVPFTPERFVMKGCYPCWKLLSTILIDNAVKYAPSNTSIIINLHETEHRKTIEISNIGPLLNPNEAEAIFMLGENYRGINAKQSGVTGQGLGLKLAKLIIMCHGWRDASIYAKSEPSGGFSLNGIPYGAFTVSFSIKNENSSHSPSGLMSTVTDNLNEFLSHEFVRINPLLSKHAVEILEDSFGGRKEYISVSNSLKKRTFKLYEAIMNHLYKCEVLWNNTSVSIRARDEMRSCPKRFSKQVFESISRRWEVNDHSIQIREKGYFSISPMYSSLYLFFFLLSKHIIKTEYKGDIQLLADRGGMQLFPPDGESFVVPNDDDKQLMDVILEENNLSIVYNTKHFDIERL